MMFPVLKRSPVFGPAIVPFLLLLLCLWPTALFAQVSGRTADVTLTGTISDVDMQRYQRIPFTLPDGTERLVVDFDYDQRDQKTVIDLGIEDPFGFRGASGGNKRSFTLAASDATPSYLPGRLTPGTWALALAIPNIRKNVVAQWTARLWFLKGAEAQTLPAAVKGRGAGWYRGDLHLHSGHSDGACPSQTGIKVPCPLFRTLETAAARGLDFVALTEHNTTSHAQVLRETQPYFDKLLLIPGREMTTFFGHFNIFGISSHIDFRIAPGIDNSFNRVADEVHALGGLVSINHPALPSGEICMGCGWTMPDVDYNKVDAIEVVNGAATASADGKADGLVSGAPFWLGQLAAGRVMTAVGGSDNHGPDREGLGAIGLPVTVVYASDLTQDAILHGIRAGRVFVALEPARRDLHLDITVSDGRHAAHMGGRLDTARGRALLVEADVKVPTGGRMEILAGNSVVDHVRLTPGASKLARPLRLAKGLHVLHVRLRGDNGQLLAFGNAVRVQVK